MGAAAQKLPEEFYTDLPVGEILRRARMQSGFSTDEVATQLRIRLSHIAALERSDFEALPGRVYVIGFVRTYAEFLGLDGGRVVDLLKRQSRGLTLRQEMNAFVPVADSRLPSVSIITVAAAALLLLLVIWVAFRGAHLEVATTLPPPPRQSGMLLEENAPLPPTADPAAAPVETSVATGITTAEPVAPTDEGATPEDAVLATLSWDEGWDVDFTLNDNVGEGEAAAPTTAPEPTEPAAATPDLPTVPAVVIKMREESWVELRNPEGRVVEARLFRAGEEYPITHPLDDQGRAYTMTVGNAAAVEVRVGGKALPSFGRVNQVRRNVALDPRVLAKLVGQ